MAAGLDVDRGRWLGYRWQQHGLAYRHGLANGQGGSPGAGSHQDRALLDDLLLLGVQGMRQAGADQSLIQRTSKVGHAAVAKAIAVDGPLVSMWSVRGAPHAHRRGQIDVVRDALAPQEDDDGGADHVKAVESVAAVLTAVVTRQMTKGEASTEVTRRVDPSLVGWCPRCKADHVPDGLFRSAGRQAQLLLDPGQRATILNPAPSGASRPTKPLTSKRPRTDLLHTFFRVNGPVSKAVFRDWLGGDKKAAAGIWASAADDLVKVDLDGRRYELPEALADQVRSAPAARGVVLVPAGDPYLRQVEHGLLVPDRARRQEVWKAVSGPGALLVDGEVAGIWRYRRSGNAVSVTPFEKLTAVQRTHVEESAAVIAGLTDDDAPTLTWD